VERTEVWESVALLIVLVLVVVRHEIREGGEMHAKAAPLQALLQTCSGTALAFENSLPDVASRSFRQRGEVGGRTTRTITRATLSIAPSSEE
jgi:hypothetical protein